MPTITLEHELLSYIQGINGIKHKSKIWDNWLTEIGCPVESNNEEQIDIEVFPDRPDLLSHETLAKTARAFLGERKENTVMDVKKGNCVVYVEKSLENVRPIIMSAIVRGVKTGNNIQEKEKFIQSLMDHQEKLHLTLGRKRKLSSIGVHDLEKIKPPFEVKTVNSSFRFVPLSENTDMSIAEILERHPKGIEYSHLMKDYDIFPVILDSNNDVVSFPPIINGEKTTVTSRTKDFFIDVTGWDRRSCEACLLLICLALGERNGIIENLEIKFSDEESLITPDGTAINHRIPDKLIEKILGVRLSNSEIKESIAKMGGELLESRTVTDGPNKAERWSDCVIGEIEHIISMPRWRSDIMHPIDIVEDIAIGFGYNNLPEQMSSIHLDSLPLKSAQMNRRIRASLRALGLQEVQSLTLSNERDQFERTRWEKKGLVTSISNPISTEHTILRQYILPSLLQILAANRHQELPQRIYELGHVVNDSKNSYSFSWSCAEVGGGFTSAKGYVQSIIRDLGILSEDVKYKPIKEKKSPWLYGRGAKIMVRDIEIGQFGEIDPRVSEKYGLKTPIHAGEFSITEINKVASDPLI